MPVTKALSNLFRRQDFVDKLQHRHSRPYTERYKKENVIIPAMWGGPVKPHGNFLIEAVVPKLVKLKNRLEREICCGEKKFVKLLVTSGVGDTLARSLMLNGCAQWKIFVSEVLPIWRGKRGVPRSEGMPLQTG